MLQHLFELSALPLQQLPLSPMSEPPLFTQQLPFLSPNPAQQLALLLLSSLPALMQVHMPAFDCPLQQLLSSPPCGPSFGTQQVPLMSPPQQFALLPLSPFWGPMQLQTPLLDCPLQQFMSLPLSGALTGRHAQLPIPLSSPEQQLEGIPLSLDPVAMQRHMPLRVCPEQQLPLVPGLPFGTHSQWPALSA